LFSSLEELDLSGNEELTGTIPRELGRLGELTRLSLSETSLSGTIPVDLADLTRLQELSLMGQNDECVGLTGRIPSEIFKSSFLRTVELQRNAFSSPLPTEVGEAINLQNLVLASSGLTGNLPTELASIDRLKVLDIGSNHFDGGPIPSELGNLSRLEFLNVANSGLNEALPETFCDGNGPDLSVLSNCSLGYPLCSCCGLISDKEGGDFNGTRVIVTCVDETDKPGDCNSSN
jgi:Leucine-rich repeat (LRR) protein